MAFIDRVLGLSLSSCRSDKTSLGLMNSNSYFVFRNSLVLQKIFSTLFLSRSSQRNTTQQVSAESGDLFLDSLSLEKTMTELAQSGEVIILCAWNWFNKYYTTFFIQ